MTNPLASILLIEDDASLAPLYEAMLKAEGYAVAVAMTAKQGIERALNERFDVVVTDLHLAGPDDFGGFVVIKQLHAAKPGLPIILMTADLETRYAIEAHKYGAFDYIPKALEPEVMLLDLRTVIKEAVAAGRSLPEVLPPHKREPLSGTIIGHSRPMQIIYKDIGRVVTSRVDVLIIGETGTGKELVARAIHIHSAQPDQPFVAVNCAALSETLLESQLFGHERGAFTGADRQHIGYFEQANHGTIFLDEIGELSTGTQAKLLRVLQERSFRRLGGTAELSVEIRVIAATHHNLEQEILENKFRKDLFHRLNRAVIHVPALCDRREDIPALVRFFLQRHARELGLTSPSLTAEAIPYLVQQENWPGNVRDLENVVCRALLMARGYPVTAEIFKIALGRVGKLLSPRSQTLADIITDLLNRAERGELENVEAALTWDIEYELYNQAIQRTGNNQAKAAKWLGVSRPTIREKLKLYGLRLEPESSGEITPPDPTS